VFALTIASLVLGLAGGVYAAIRFLPPLASTREGTMATWVVRLLFGCAVAWTAQEIYVAVHQYAYLGSDTGLGSIGSTRAEILKSTVESTLLLGSLLVGSASIVYLLAPADEPHEAPAVGD
jgi:hypothetical protein